MNPQPRPSGELRGARTTAAVVLDSSVCLYSDLHFLLTRVHQVYAFTLHLVVLVPLSGLLVFLDRICLFGEFCSASLRFTFHVYSCRVEILFVGVSNSDI